MANNNQNTENLNIGPAAALRAAPVSPKREQADVPSPKKLVVKQEAVDVTADFQAVRGALPTERTPSLAQKLILPSQQDEQDRIKRRLFRDISVIRLNHSDDEASGITAARNDLRDRAEDGHSYSYGYNGDYDGGGDSGYVSESYWQDAVNYNNNYMYSLEQNIRDNDFQQQILTTKIEDQTRAINDLDNEKTALLQERDDTTLQILQAQKDLAAAEEFSKHTGEHLDEKLKEMYPDGKEPAMNEPDPIRDKEAQLHDKAYAEHREELLAFYKSKGFEQEFLAMEKVPEPGGDDSKFTEAMGRVQKAGLPYDPNIVLLDVLRREDPKNPYLDTLHAARIDVGNSWQLQVKAQAYGELQEKAAKEQIDKIDKRVEDIDQRIKELQEQKSNNEKELKKLQDTRTEMTQKLEQAKKYDEWLKSPETQAKLKSGQLTLDEFKAQTPKFMADGWIDDPGGECVNPNTARGQKLAAQIETNNQISGSRSITSAASSDIATVDAKGSFNTVAQAALESASTPTPEAAPVQKPVAPAPAPVSGMA